MKKTFVELQNVSFKYNSSLVLDDISFNVNEGDFLAIVGPNGSGKSTLLKIILGLLKPKGEIKLLVNHSLHSNTVNGLDMFRKNQMPSILPFLQR